MEDKFIFVPTDEYREEPDKWSLLGLKPIPYNPKNQHHELWEGIRGWGQINNRKPTEHQNEIKRIISKDSELTQHENDFLRFCLNTNDSQASDFFQLASQPFWFTWAYNQGLLEALFKYDHELTSIDQQFINWFVKNFALVDLPETSIVINSSKELNYLLINRLTLHISQIKDIHDYRMIRSWLFRILSSTHIPQLNFLFLALKKCRLPEDADIAYLGLSKLANGRDLNNLDRITHEEIKKVWSEHFKPQINIQLAIYFEPVIAHVLEFIEFQRAYCTGTRPPFISRPCIEEHKCNNKQSEPVNVFIDMGRDIIECLVNNNNSNGYYIINNWYHKTSFTLRRLAIYGLRLQKCAASEKLHWVLNQTNILDSRLKHENFALINIIYPHLSSDQRFQLFNKIEEVSTTDYDVYNFAVWLTRVDTECELTKNKLNQLQEANPSFKPRAYPDIDYYMISSQTSFKERANSLININLSEITEEIQNSQDKIDIFGNDHVALLNALQQACADNPDWGVALAQYLIKQKMFDRDIWRMILSGLEGSSDASDSSVNQVVNLVYNYPDIRKQCYDIIAKMLNRHGERIFTIMDHQTVLKLANRVTNDTLSTPQQQPYDPDADWIEVANNRPGYNLCMFYGRYIDKNKSVINDWCVEFEKIFRPFINSDNFEASMGKMAIAQMMPFLYQKSQQWTTKHILPFFDWENDKELAAKSWQAYLTHGNFTSELLTPLKKLHDKAFGYFKNLGRFRDHYCYHMARLALYLLICQQINSLKDGWLMSFISQCEPQDLNVFIQGVLELLIKNENVKQNHQIIWTNFLSPYLDLRVAGKPQQIEGEELFWIFHWCLYLDHYVSDCVYKVINLSKTANIQPTVYNNLDLFHVLPDVEQISKHPEEVGKLVNHLLWKGYVCSYNWEFLSKTIERLNDSGCSGDIINKIVQNSVHNGFSEASRLLSTE